MILAFDPGVTTGIAVLENDGTVLETYAASLDEAEIIIPNLANAHEDPSVVIEAPPAMGGNYRPITQRIEELLRRHFPDARWTNPGQWKGTPASRTPVEKKLTQHEKDAVHLGRWLKSVSRRQNGTEAAQ